MLLSKVNRRASGAVQPRKKNLTQSGLKKFTQKRQPSPTLKFPAATSQNKNKTDATTSRPKELDLLPPSDSEDDWGSKSKAAETFWRPLHRLSVKAPTDNHSIKAQAKVEFDNISKRINKVLDDYEYQLQIKRTEASTEAFPIMDKKKDSVRGVLSDYMDVCDERKELLYQLQEWFEEDHLKEDMFQDEEIDTAAGDIMGLKKTLMERQKVKRKLNMIKFDLDTRAMMTTNQQKVEKEKMEQELVEAKEALKKMKNTKSGMPPLTGAAAAENANSWKYAAAEIHQILSKARDEGTANIYVMEQKLAEMVTDMTEQTSRINKLESELQKKEEIINGNEVEISALERHKNELNSTLEKTRAEVIQDKMVIDSHKQTNETIESTMKEQQDKIALLNQEIEELQNENKELMEKATKTTKATEELAAMPPPPPSATKSPPPKNPKGPRSRAASVIPMSRGGTPAPSQISRPGTVTPSIPAAPKITTHNVGVQVGGIFLDAKMISLPDNKKFTETSNITVQCMEEEPPKSEVQIEHETQITKLKSSLQLAYKEISEMQCLIEELQSQVLPSPEPHKIEDKISSPYMSTLDPSPSPQPSPEPEPSPVQLIVKILSKSTSDSIPTSLQRKKTIQYERSISVDSKKCRSLSMMSLKKSKSISRPSPSPEEDANWMDVISFTKLNLTPQEIQDTMKQMLMLENDPKSVTRSIVANALEQVNVNTDKVSNMISNDNLSSFQEELTSMCDAIAGFLDYSSNLVEKEAKVIDDAVTSLLAKLPEEEKARMNKLQTTNEIKEKLQEKIAVIVRPAFTALQKGGELISSNMKKQNENLQAAMTALADYKMKQRGSYEYELPFTATNPLENKYELLPLREKAVPDKQGGLTVRYEEPTIRQRYRKGLMVPKLAKFPIIHGYHFGGGRLLYYGRPKPRTPHQYGKAQRGPLAIHATGYYSGTSSRAATSHAYRMSTHPPIPAKQQRLLRPLSRHHFRPTSTYRPGNILAPLSKQKSTYYQPTQSKNDAPTRRTYGQSNYLDIISNPEYFGRPLIHPSANVQIKATSLPPINRHQN